MHVIILRSSSLLFLILLTSESDFVYQKSLLSLPVLHYQSGNTLLQEKSRSESYKSSVVTSDQNEQRLLLKNTLWSQYHSRLIYWTRKLRVKSRCWQKMFQWRSTVHTVFVKVVALARRLFQRNLFLERRGLRLPPKGLVRGGKLPPNRTPDSSAGSPPPQSNSKPVTGLRGGLLTSNQTVYQFERGVTPPTSR